MALVNLKDKEIQVINIYYGPGWGDKTSLLAYINRNFANRINSEMTTIKRHGECTFFLNSFHLISNATMVSM
jgi:hypothetical protein